MGWLFDTTDLGVTERRVSQGLNLIAPLGPHANFNWSPLQPIAGESIILDTSNSLPGWNGTITIPIVQYTWDLGDGINATGSTVNHTYTSPGNYSIELNVTDSQGSWDAEQKQIEVANVVPEFHFVLAPTLILVTTIFATILLARKRKPKTP